MWLPDSWQGHLSSEAISTSKRSVVLRKQAYDRKPRDSRCPVRPRSQQGNFAFVQHTQRHILDCCGLTPQLEGLEIAHDQFFRLLHRSSVVHINPVSGVRKSRHPVFCAQQHVDEFWSARGPAGWNVQSGGFAEYVCAAAQRNWQNRFFPVVYDFPVFDGHLAEWYEERLDMCGDR